MAIEVFHWNISYSAREDKKVLNDYFATKFGDVEKIAELLKDPELNERGISLVKVAEVAGGSKANAFRLTNHIGHSWTDNDGVSVCGHGRWRSTSVGDIMRVNDEAYVVSAFGFTKLPQDVLLTEKASTSPVISI